ncbi:MAG TPA: glycosyltransferase family 1 protein, partial [Candidatus Altiarchaeales archaeon]|nr:glycosyltransferase family 1 protein [Candidatus Altiarchaeales archaeon]
MKPNKNAALKKLLVIPPIPVYDMIGDKLNIFPAPVIRERLLVLEPFFDKITVVSGSFSENTGYSADGKFLIEKISYKKSGFPKTLFLKTFFVLKYLKTVSRHLECGTVMLNFNPLLLGLLTNLLAKVRKIRNASFFIGFPAQWCVSTRKSELLYHLNMKVSSVNIAVSPVLEKKLRELGGRKIIVIPNRVRRQENISLEGVPDTIFSAARLSPEKRPEYLIKCFAKVAGKKPAARLFLAGDGETKPLEDYAEKLGVRDKINFLGKIPKEKVLDYMKKSTLFVLTSVGEGFGMVYLEAMACGIPIIGMDSGSTPWVLGDAGVVVRVDDEKQLASEIIRLLEDEKARRKLVEAGLKRIKDFPYETWGKDMYKELI